MPPLEVPVVSEKLRYLAQHGDEYNVIFLGTSRVHRQLLPIVFDRRMAKAGVRTHSFNLGIDGLHSPEDDFVLEKALNSRRRPLRWVILEGRDINLRMEDINDESTRSLYWQDVPRMWVLGERVVWGGFPKDVALRQRVRGLRGDLHVLLCHCVLWGQNFACMGAGEKLIRSRVFGPPVSTAPDLKDDGFVSPGNPFVDRRSGAAYEQELEMLMKHPAEINYKDRASQMLLRRMTQLCAVHKARLVLVVPPTLTHEKYYPDPQYRPCPPVIDLDDPLRFPELFDMKNRRDSTHLNQKGALAFTELVVDKMIAFDAHK